MISDAYMFIIEQIRESILFAFIGSLFPSILYISLSNSISVGFSYFILQNPNPYNTLWNYAYVNSIFSNSYYSIYSTVIYVYKSLFNF